MGNTGLYELTRNKREPPRIAPELEQTILNIRRRLKSPVHPQTRYGLIGASAIGTELKALHIPRSLVYALSNGCCHAEG